MTQQDQALEVARDAKIAAMAVLHSAQALVLLAYRPLPHPPASLIDCPERAHKTILRRQLPIHRVALAACAARACHLALFTQNGGDSAAS
jgi:hypothetical protein